MQSATEILISLGVCLFGEFAGNLTGGLKGVGMVLRRLIGPHGSVAARLALAKTTSISKARLKLVLYR